MDIKRRIKFFYNVLAVFLFFVIFLSFINVAFAQVPSGLINNPVSINYTWIYDEDVIDTCDNFGVGGGNDPVLYLVLSTENTSYSPLGIVIDYVEYPLSDTSNINFSYSGNLPIGNYDNFIVACARDLDTDVNGYNFSIFSQQVTGFFGSPLYIILDSASGFGSFLGSTTPMSIISDVTNGVQDTGQNITPIIGLTGVPVAFGIVGYLIWFIRRSTL